MIDVRAGTTDLAHRRSRFRGSQRSDRSHLSTLTCYSIIIFVSSFYLEDAPARSTIGEPHAVDAFMIRSTPHLNSESMISVGNSAKS